MKPIYRFVTDIKSIESEEPCLRFILFEPEELLIEPFEGQDFNYQTFQEEHVIANFKIQGRNVLHIFGFSKSVRKELQPLIDCINDQGNHIQQLSRRVNQTQRSIDEQVETNDRLRAENYLLKEPLSYKLRRMFTGED